MDRITIYATGNWDVADSYGLVACQLARHLDALGVHVNAAGFGKTIMESQPADVRAVTERPILPSLGGIVLGYPTGYAGHSSLLWRGPRVAVTMFESSRLPEGWAEPLNQMDAVIVPSHFCAEVFGACGVTVPIHVVPLGIGDAYLYSERPFRKPLTFLAFLDRGERKGGIVAQQAFYRAFGDDPDYRLILKSRTPKQVRLSFTNPTILTVQEDLSEEELCRLYLECDVLINPNRGEGFGLIPREFSASGGLALATAWGGTADELDAWGMGLPYTLEKAKWTGHKIHEGQALGEWAVVDPVLVAERLLDIAGHWETYRSQLATKAAMARQLYSWRAFTEGVYRVWKEAADGYGN